MQGGHLHMVNAGIHNFNSYLALDTYKSGVASQPHLALCTTGGRVAIGDISPACALDIAGEDDDKRGYTILEL